MLAARNLWKSFGRVTAVAGVSLDARPGEVTALLGPNGAGKTTTIRMLTGVIAPDGGTVHIDGRDIASGDGAARGAIGYLPEAAPLYVEMTVRGYLAFRARLHRMSGGTARDAIDRAMTRCRVADVAGRTIGHLSRGYRQRVGLAAAILHSPRVLVLDEPTSALDPAQVAQTRALIRELARDCAVVLSSHVLHEVEQVADRAIVIARGVVLAAGTLAELRARAPAAGGRATLRLWSGTPEAWSALAGELAALPTVRSASLRTGGPRGAEIEVVLGAGGPAGTEGHDAARELAMAALRAGIAASIVMPEEPVLERVFLDVLAGAAQAEGGR